MTPAAPALAADRPLLGILLMLGFCVVIPMSDALAKILGDTVPLLQLIVVRFAAQTALLLPVALALRLVLFPSYRIVWLMLYRTVLQILGIGMMFTALRFLPLADAVAIAFVMPFMMLLLGKYVLGEEVGPRRLGACVVGFVGTLMVVQPSFTEVGLPALLPLAVALVFSLYMLVTRQIAKSVDPIALQSASGLMGLPLLAPLFVFAPGPFGASPPMIGWITPSGLEMWLLLAIGFSGALGHFLMSSSLRYAPSATLAPMQYLEIPVATFIGWLIFRDLPDGLAAAGIVLTIAAGLYIVAREHRMTRAAPTVV